MRTNGDRMAVRVLDAWTGHLQADDTVITFNWDILHEAALWRAHKWHYADGYGFVCTDAPPRMHSSLKILKLHGSVNWVQASENDCEPAVEYKADFFPPARDDQRIYKAAAEININRGRNFIIPSYLKDVSSNRLLLALWNQASEAIANASELTVVGFQLHPSDALARHLLASALLRNNRLPKVTVVSPREGINDWARMNYWNDYCRNLGKMSVFYPMTFEEWVLKQV